MLDQYLDTLAKEASVTQERRQHLETMDLQDLARVAGVKIAMTKCSKCGGDMHKEGSMMKCSCGMMKAGALPKALKKNVKKVKRMQTSAPGAETNPAALRKTSMVKVADMVKQAEEDGVKLAHDIARAHAYFEGDLEKVAVYLQEQGMDKEAIMPILRAIGRSGLNVGKNLARGNWAVAGKSLAAMPKAIGRGASESWKGISSMPELYGKARAAGQGRAASLWESMKNPAFMGAGSRRAIKAQGLAAAKKAKPTAAGAAAPAATKTSSVADVGDAAGRILAKMAQGVPMEELQESIEEARAREDIPGRARRWQIGGGVGGGLAGLGVGAGTGGALFGRKGALIGGALGAIPGAIGGQYLGKQHGAEEAAADKAISMLRAMRAHRIGMTSGARAGARAGYMAGMQRGAMMTGGAPKTAAVDEEGMVDPGWVDAQHGMYRAMRAKDKGVGQFMADPDLITKRLTHGLAGTGIGVGAGAGIGTLIAALARKKLGPAAAIGGALGGVAGLGAGSAHGDYSYLKGKGVHPKWLGLAGAKFTPEAAEKYKVE